MTMGGSSSLKLTKIISSEYMIYVAPQPLPFYVHEMLSPQLVSSSYKRLGDGAVVWNLSSTQ